MCALAFDREHLILIPFPPLHPSPNTPHPIPNPQRPVPRLMPQHFIILTYPTHHVFDFWRQLAHTYVRYRFRDCDLQHIQAFMSYAG